MKIALIGIRGIPVIYSGFESFAESFAISIAKLNHDVTVYCRKRYVKGKLNKHKGVNIIITPSISTKNLETITHSFFSTIHSIFFSKYDVIYYFGVGSSLFSILPRIFGIKTIVNVDGLDWKREKWGIPAKTFLYISEYLACFFPNKTITDSIFIKRYYKKRYNKITNYIPYGYSLGENIKYDIFNKLKLTKNKYFVWSGRFVPDNHLDELIKAVDKIKKINFKIVICGGELINSKYSKEIYKRLKNNKRYLFTGFIDKANYAGIIKNSFCYIETKRSGGTHPSLIEAMYLGKLIISNNSSTNKNILKNFAIYYKNNDSSNLKRKIISSTKLSKKEINIYTKNVKLIAKKQYNSNLILKKYLTLLEKLTNINK